ncbi:hypothetical protein KCP69_12450 [Salmonella enterica subsp. enterica]|nr:hypothetical protein KCP69_12450 [Salmonella enterica subsp. enterica]
MISLRYSSADRIRSRQQKASPPVRGHPDRLRRVDVGAGNCGTDRFAGRDRARRQPDILRVPQGAARRRHQSDAGDPRDLAPRGFLPMSSTRVIGIAFEVTASVIIGGPPD